MALDQRLHELASDRSSGASEITARACRLLCDIARESDDPAADVLEAGVDLIEAHPAMAPLVDLVDRALSILDAQGAGGLEDLVDSGHRREQAVVEAGARLIEGEPTVATYSRSGTVLGALLAADPPPSVLISEARPGQEGLEVARRLAEVGLQVTVTVDAALPGLLEEADRLLVGADSLCSLGVVNKVGTGALALAAAEVGCPVTVLAATDKLLPAAYREVPPLTAQGELGVELPEAIATRVPLFELVPWQQVDHVVTEAGPQPVAELRTAIGEAALHPAIAERLSPG